MLLQYLRSPNHSILQEHGGCKGQKLKSCCMALVICAAAYFSKLNLHDEDYDGHDSQQMPCCLLRFLEQLKGNLLIVDADGQFQLCQRQLEQDSKLLDIRWRWSLPWPKYCMRMTSNSEVAIEDVEQNCRLFFLERNSCILPCGFLPSLTGVVDMSSKGVSGSLGVKASNGC